MAKTKTKVRRIYVKPKRKGGKKHDVFHIGALLGAGIGVGLPIGEAYNPDVGAKENAVNIAGSLSGAMFGYNIATKSFDMGALKEFWIPTIMGYVVTKVANMTGLNRYMPRRVKL